MEVIYKNNLDDIIAINYDLIRHDKNFKKKKIWGLHGSPLFLLLSFVVFAYVANIPSFYAGGVIGSLVSYLWALYFYKNYPKKIAKQLQKQKEVYSEHTVTLTPDGVREKTINSESYLKWEAIDHISITEDYIFIYNTPITAHIIPKRVIGEDEFLKVKSNIEDYQVT